MTEYFVLSLLFRRYCTKSSNGCSHHCGECHPSNDTIGFTLSLRRKLILRNKILVMPQSVAVGRRGCCKDGILHVQYFAIGVIVVTGKVNIGIPPFGQGRWLQKVQNVRDILGNRKMIVSFINGFPSPSIGQRPDFHLPGDYRVIEFVWMQISAPHGSIHRVE